MGGGLFLYPHRGVQRGVGGIFYDHLDAEGASFDPPSPSPARSASVLAVFPAIVRRRMGLPFTADEERRMLAWRGRYAEFNLVYDRGTTFGLKTGGNVDAILMSLPPRAIWE